MPMPMPMPMAMPMAMEWVECEVPGTHRRAKIRCHINSVVVRMLMIGFYSYDSTF